MHLHNTAPLDIWTQPHTVSYPLLPPSPKWTCRRAVKHVPLEIPWHGTLAKERGDMQMEPRTISRC